MSSDRHEIEGPLESLLDRQCLENSLLAFGVWNEKILPFLEEQVEGFFLGLVVGEGDEVGMGVGQVLDLHGVVPLRQIS